MKIKLFQSMFEKKLERQVNDFLLNKNIEVIELQHAAGYGFFSVMIVYKELYSQQTYGGRE